jgi:hypothetical protein
MRTTLTLDDEAAEIVSQYARSRELSLSKAVSELIVRGTRRPVRIKLVDGLPVFDLPRSDKTLALDQIKAMAEDK